MASDVRKSPLAGRWYPAQPDALRAMLDGFLQDAQPESAPGTILGLLSPHAGIRYSGPVAAYAYAQVKDMSFDTVAVIGPMHHDIPGAVLTSDHNAYETPLGQVAVDTAALTEIGRQIKLTYIRDDPEHSVEIELPFLQRVLKPGWSLIPVMLRDQSKAQARDLGAALAEVLRGRRALLVASSDLSHYYPQHVANELDTKMLERVQVMDADGVIEYSESGTAYACGYGAIGTAITAARAWGADKALITRYATSGDVTGDFEQVVGYGSAIFCA